MIDVAGVTTRRHTPRHDWWTVAVLLAALLAVAGIVLVELVRPERTWVQVTQATAANASSTELQLMIGICDTSARVPRPIVVETPTEIRVSVDLHVRNAGDSRACAAGATVTLNDPIGTRRVVDGHTHHQVTLFFTNG